MSLLKKLASETALYGLSSIIGRFLNYLLVPIYTRVFATGEYGQVSELYAYAGFVMVLLSYRLETAFFRFSQKDEDKARTYSTLQASLWTSTTLFVVAAWLGTPWLAQKLEYTAHPEYLRYFCLILALDALCELPFARLRQENRVRKFVSLKLFNIALSISLNLFWLVLCPYLANRGVAWVHHIWRADIGVGYVFLANLIASACTFLGLLPQARFRMAAFDGAYLRQILRYSAPLVVVSFAGIINEMVDRTLLKHLLPGTTAENLSQIGIYSANYKLAMLITLFTQAYRYAAEPFFFKNAAANNSMDVQAQATKWFTLATSSAMMGILMFLPILKNFIGSKYLEGLQIVPILLLANVFLGIYYNFSIWYRLKDKTMLGAWIAIVGALITLVLNIWWIPRWGYVGSAWATVVCYLFMVVACWVTGRKYYPAPYPLVTMALYIAIPLMCYAVVKYGDAWWQLNPLLFWGVRIALLLVYGLLVWWKERGTLKI